MEKEQLLDHIIRETREHYYAQLPFELSHDQLAQGAERFLDMIALPQIANIFPLSSRPEDSGITIGYRRVNADTPTGDVKTILHYHPETFAMRYAANIAHAPREVHDWLESADDIHAAGRRLRNRVLDALELKVPGIKARFLQPPIPDFDYTRFLAYDVKEVREILAAGHNDRGPLDFALAESAPGIRFGPPGYQREIVHEDRKAIFQPGCSIEDLCGDLFVPAWHDVLQGDHPPARANVSRWAIIYFTDHHGKRPVSHQEAHTPRYHKHHQSSPTKTRSA